MSTPDGDRPRTIVVLGDPAVLRLYQVGYRLGPPTKDQKKLIVSHELRTPLFNEIPEHVRFWRLPWGAGLVHELIEFASTAREPEAKGGQRIGYSYVWAELPDHKVIHHALKEQDADGVVQAAGRWEDYWDGRWRVRQTTGPTRPPILHYGDDQDKGIKDFVCQRKKNSYSGQSKLVTVIDDLGHNWATEEKVKTQLEEVIQTSGTLIVKLETLLKPAHLGKPPAKLPEDHRYKLINELKTLLGIRTGDSVAEAIQDVGKEVAGEAAHPLLAGSLGEEGESAPKVANVTTPAAIGTTIGVVDRELQNSCEQLILHVHLRSLRDAGSEIRQSLSWESVTDQIAAALYESDSPLLDLLKNLHCPATAIVSLGHAGCVIAARLNPKELATGGDAPKVASQGKPDGAAEVLKVSEPTANLPEEATTEASCIQVRLVADFETLELLPERRYSGQSFGSGRYVLASLAAAAAKKQCALSIVEIAEAVRSGVQVGRDIFDNGYGDRRVRQGLAKREEVSREKLGLLDNSSDEKKWKYKIETYQIPVSSLGTLGNRSWHSEPNRQGKASVASGSVLRDSWNRWNEQDRKKLVQELVRTGKLDAPIPSFRVEKWISYDREEIERAREVMLAVGVYLDQTEEKEFPFGMTVFGSPGSGKSFFVKQLIEMLNRDIEGRRDVKKIKKIEINLSQLRSESDLLYEFDKVRDVAAQGMIPAVIWDEFDSNLQSLEYGWIKSFLDPLQQGKYRRERDTGDLGKSLFIFAGGTCPTIRDWDSRVAQKKVTNPELKLHDFDSRIRVRFEIKKIAIDFTKEASEEDLAKMTPQEREEKFNEDEQRKFDNFKIQIRRAAVLRGQLLQWWPNLQKDEGGKNVDIAVDVIEQLVFSDQFRYDVRSMEQIVRASALTGSSRFERSALPPISILRGHLEPPKRNDSEMSLMCDEI